MTNKGLGVIGLDHETLDYWGQSIEYELSPYGGDGTNPNANGEIDSERDDNYSRFNGFGNGDSFKGIFRCIGPRSAKAM